MLFWNSLAFSMIQQMLAIFCLVPLIFLYLACTSGSSQFTYWWSLAWRIWALTCQLVNSERLYGGLNILLHCLSLGLEWKLTFPSPCSHCWIFQICWHIEYSILTVSSFRIWNSSTGIPSHPLAFFVIMPCLPPGHLPNPELQPRSPALQAVSLPSEPKGKPKNTGVDSLSLLQGFFPTQESNQVS